MKLLKYIIIVIFVINFSIVTAKDLPSYKMVDLGIFEMDSSNAITINEKGQVLGTCEAGTSKYIFLWDENNGLKLIDLPDKVTSLIL